MALQIRLLTVGCAALGARKLSARMDADKVPLEHVGVVKPFVAEVARDRPLVRVNLPHVGLEMLRSAEELAALGTSQLLFHVRLHVVGQISLGRGAIRALRTLQPFAVGRRMLRLDVTVKIRGAGGAEGTLLTQEQLQSVAVDRFQMFVESQLRAYFPAMLADDGLVRRLSDHPLVVRVVMMPVVFLPVGEPNPTSLASRSTVFFSLHFRRQISAFVVMSLSLLAVVAVVMLVVSGEVVEGEVTLAAALRSSFSSFGLNQIFSNFLAKIDVDVVWMGIFIQVLVDRNVHNGDHLIDFSIFHRRIFRLSLQLRHRIDFASDTSILFIHLLTVKLVKVSAVGGCI